MSDTNHRGVSHTEGRERKTAVGGDKEGHGLKTDTHTQRQGGGTLVGGIESGAC